HQRDAAPGLAVDEAGGRVDQVVERLVEIVAGNQPRGQLPQHGENHKNSFQEDSTAQTTFPSAVGVMPHSLARAWMTTRPRPLSASVPPVAWCCGGAGWPSRTARRSAPGLAVRLISISVPAWRTTLLTSSVMTSCAAAWTWSSRQARQASSTTCRAIAAAERSGASTTRRPWLAPTPFHMAGAYP